MTVSFTRKIILKEKWIFQSLEANAHAEKCEESGPLTLAYLTSRWWRQTVTPAGGSQKTITVLCNAFIWWLMTVCMLVHLWDTLVSVLQSCLSVASSDMRQGSFWTVRHAKISWHQQSCCQNQDVCCHRRNNRSIIWSRFYSYRPIFVSYWAGFFFSFSLCTKHLKKPS